MTDGNIKGGRKLLARSEEETRAEERRNERSRKEIYTIPSPRLSLSVEKSGLATEDQQP